MSTPEGMESTNKPPCNTESELLGDLCGVKDDRPPKRHQIMPGSASDKEVNPSPHNIPASDTPKAKRPLRQGRYAMLCMACGFENCISGANRPVRMECIFCDKMDDHLSMNCPTFVQQKLPKEFSACYASPNSLKEIWMTSQREKAAR